MNRSLFYLAIAGIAVVLQTVFLPLVLRGYSKPDLILILVIYLGLHEKPWRGGLLVYLIGWCYDGVAGVFLGLNGFVLLGIFLVVRGIVARVNAESSPLLFLLVAAGTVLQFVLAAFALDFFSQAARIWPQMAWQLPVQLLLNLIATLILLYLTAHLQRIFLPRRGRPGLRTFDSRYEP
ncbi:MAG: rod shape-determining protein MreD [Desulfuromonadales bacterium]|nr:rod shape-determining protein MreD [Desulfuromonadales bacterium]